MRRSYEQYTYSHTKDQFSWVKILNWKMFLGQNKRNLSLFWFRGKLKLMFIITFCCFGQKVFKKLQVAKWFWIKPDFVYLDKNRCIFHHVNLVSTDECVLRIICMYQSVETKHIIQNTNYFLNFFMMRSFSHAQDMYLNWFLSQGKYC